MGIETILDTGMMSSQVVEDQGEKIFKKTIPCIKTSFIRKLEKKLILDKFGSHPYNSHLICSNDYIKYLEREVFTSYDWGLAGIPTLDFKGLSENSISWKYIQDTQSVRQALNEKDSMKIFDNFVDVYDKIRKVAKKKHNVMYLHSDPHLGNFLKTPNNLVIPIDSGCLLNRNLSFDELDFHLLKRTMYSINEIETSKDMKINYLTKFIELMSDKNKEMFLNWDFSLSPVLRGYLNFKERAASLIKERGRVNNFKNYDNFVSLFNSNIRQILEK